MRFGWLVVSFPIYRHPRGQLGVHDQIDRDRLVMVRACTASSGLAFSSQGLDGGSCQSERKRPTLPRCLWIASLRRLSDRAHNHR
jgi:hypothetical protein